MERLDHHNMWSTQLALPLMRKSALEIFELFSDHSIVLVLGLKRSKLGWNLIAFVSLKLTIHFSVAFGTIAIELTAKVFA